MFLVEARGLGAAMLLGVDSQFMVETQVLARKERLDRTVKLTQINDTTGRFVSLEPGSWAKNVSSI